MDAAPPPAACWQTGAAAPARILRGVLVRADAPEGSRWTLNLPQPVCVAGLAGKVRSVRLLPADAAAERRLRSVIRLRVTFRGRPAIAGEGLVLRVG